MQILFILFSMFFTYAKPVEQAPIVALKIPVECIKLRKGIKVEKTKVVTTRETFKNYFLEDFSHSNCTDVALKSFSIESYTLVGFYETIAGCTMPKEIINIYNKVDTTFVEIVLEQSGNCEKNNTIYSWYSFPKQETSYIQFLVTKRTK